MASLGSFLLYGSFVVCAYSAVISVVFNAYIQVPVLRPGLIIFSRF